MAGPVLFAPSDWFPRPGEGRPGPWRFPTFRRRAATAPQPGLATDRPGTEPAPATGARGLYLEFGRFSVSGPARGACLDRDRAPEAALRDHGLGEDPRRAPGWNPEWPFFLQARFGRHD